jgi:hypothetical protein
MDSIHTILHDLSWADWQLGDPGASGRLRSDQTGMIDLISAAAETRTIRAPARAGIILGINGQNLVGAITLTFKDITGVTNTPYNLAGNNTMVFATADFTLLISRKYGTAFRWQTVVVDNPTQSTV